MEKRLEQRAAAFLASLVVLFFMTACSNTEFGQREMRSQSYTVNVGRVDILFVVDNSGSMSTEQKRMAESFPNFVQGLDLAGLDYRIGIITTDVQSSTNRLVGDGRLQNGNLLEFPNGSFYLSPETRNIEDEFAKTIKRDETLECEDSGYNKDICPSDDERGIYAAYLAVNANKKNFFRENSHIAFVFLSDEDVRGFGNSERQYPFMLPEALDYPENLINLVSARFDESTDLSAHAIVTNNESCRQEQMAQGGNQYIHGAIGSFYMAMTQPEGAAIINNSGVLMKSFSSGSRLVKGTIGSICSRDYVSELGSIKNVLSKTKAVERLKCKIFKEDTLDIRVDSDYTWTLSENKMEVRFNPPLPPGKSFKISYDCL